jgi:carbamate kinase
MNEAIAKTAVVAVGGNALILDSDRTSIDDQYEAACRTASRMADLLVAGWRVVLTHGNGPQVGFILRRSELAIDELPPVPMHYAGADIQGAVGYMFVTALRNELAKRNNDSPVAAVVTRVLVDPDDPAFAHPTKPIGAHMDQARAERLASEFGWDITEDSGRGWRRVVPSPQPREILDLDAIRVLADNGYTIVGCGGGGIPVMMNASGELEGVEAVIDKDLASSLLARRLGVGIFVIITAVRRVALNFGKPDERSLDRLTVSEAREYLAAGHFGRGSMAPKVQAVLEYVEATGRPGIITDADHLEAAVEGRDGTRIVPDAGEEVEA